jgi:arabinan endo-1,5-alpha-L-arabinosidase
MADGAPIQFRTAPGAPMALTIAVQDDGQGRVFTLADDARRQTYRLPDRRQASYLDAFADWARDWGCRAPLSRREAPQPSFEAPLRPLLTRPVSPRILYGYGDPCVTRAVDPTTGRPTYYLLVTSNDAPDAFPILKSQDLADWRLTGFVFAEGRTPDWTLTGEGRADFWAPEMHRVGDEYWVCFTARRQDRSLAIGIARSASPEGPFIAGPAPVLGDGVIDPHILLDRGGAPLLLWKEDANGVWPPLLAELLHGRGDLVASLFPADRDARTAALLAALWPWTRTIEPMEQFFVLQPLIEAVTEDFAAFGDRMRAVIGREPALAPEAWPILTAMKTRVHAQRLGVHGQDLVGDRRLIVENDQTWEAHLIEGVWVTAHAGRYYLFYSGNDFSTHHYGIGAAVADDPLGPYRKLAPLLRSTREWSGPGHPSVAPGPDGAPMLFLHAFMPGQVGYKAFRALLCARLAFGPDGPRLI